MARSSTSTRNPFKTMYRGTTHNLSKDGMHRPEGAGNFDNMDDHNVVKTTSLSQGTIQHTPLNDKDIVNKIYVDTEIVAVSGLIAVNRGIIDNNTGSINDNIGSISDNLNLITNNTGNITTLIGSDVKYLGSIVVNKGLIDTNISDIATTSGALQVTSGAVQPLLDNSMVDTLHRHSELSASDGSPDRALVVSAIGNVGIGTTGALTKLHIVQENVFTLDENAVDNKDNIYLQSANTAGSGNYGGAITWGRPDGTGGTKKRRASIASVQSTATTHDVGLAFFVTDGGGSGSEMNEVVRVENDGKVGIGTSSPTLPLDVKAKSGMSAIGGICIKLTNKTGGNTVQGQLVKVDTATNDAVILTAGDDLECFGVFLESGIADDAEAWVVVSGIADVAMQDNTAATRGNWVRTSITEAGYADATNNDAPQPINQTHFAEIGHCIETVTATGGGTHILARCVLHFN